MIKTNGFIVTYFGDETVGIFGSAWVLSGEFIFDDKQDFEEFKQKIADAFCLVSDTPIIVESMEERSSEINNCIQSVGARHSV